MPVLARKHRSKLRPFLFLICTVSALFLGLVGLLIVFPVEYRDDILQWSAIYDLDPAWVASVIRSESNFLKDAVSPAGAIGLMQIMPETGEWIAEQLGISEYTPVKLRNPSFNIHLGTWYLRYLLDRFDTTDAALMAYNAGPTNADRWEGNLKLAFPETQQYMRHVHFCLPIYRAYFKAWWLVDLIPSVRFLY